MSVTTSPFVSPSSGGLAVGVDVGGTKIAAGVVDESGTILATERRPTPSRTPDAVADTIADLVNLLRQSFEVSAVGIGAAGWIDRARAVVQFAPNLAWRDEPLRDEVSRRIGLPVVVENDANAAGWAEYRFGAGRGHDDLVCVTVGTGIGGGIVLDGRLHRGAFGIGGEIGHMQIVAGGQLCGCGSRGCWEQYASGRALVRAAKEMVAAAPSVNSRLLDAAGGEVERITGPEVTKAAADGDPTAVKCFEEIGHWLGRGLASMAAVLDPGRFVVGGGVSDAGDLLLGPAREEFEAVLPGRGHRPVADVVVAALGAEAGLVGAADLTRR